MVAFATAAICFAASLALGFYVHERPPTRLDLLAQPLRGAGTPLAAVFTALGRTYGILALALVVAASAMAMGTKPIWIATLLGSQLLAQFVVTLLKRVFRRTRPDYWLLRFERDLSYPSGHSATAIVFFIPLVALALYGHIVPENAAAPVAALFAACVVGIPWSRLALGAHYLTDVIGGLLFGAGWLCMTLGLTLLH